MEFIDKTFILLQAIGLSVEKRLNIIIWLLVILIIILHVLTISIIF